MCHETTVTTSNQIRNETPISLRPYILRETFRKCPLCNNTMLSLHYRSFLSEGISGSKKGFRCTHCHTEYPITQENHLTPITGELLPHEPIPPLPRFQNEPNINFTKPHICLQCNEPLTPVMITSIEAPGCTSFDSWECTWCTSKNE